jgi:hypothetical protein
MTGLRELRYVFSSSSDCLPVVYLVTYRAATPRAPGAPAAEDEGDWAVKESEFVEATPPKRKRW